jgi:putative acetyltransferase
VIDLRPYDPVHDLAACLAIWEAASRGAHGFLGDAAIENDRDLVRDVYMPHAAVTVAETGGNIAGFIALIAGTEEDGAPVARHVGGLFVSPAVQGVGIGRRLVEAVADGGPLTVEVYAANHGARAFYRRLRFRETGRRPLDDRGRPHLLIALRRD